MMTATAERYAVVDLDELHDSPMNPRQHYDDAKLEEMAATMRTAGVIEPLIVRPRPAGDGYEIAAGHRRKRAARIAELAAVPVIIRELDDLAFLEVLNIDNLQRENLNAIEEASGYRTLLDAKDPSTGKAAFDVHRIAERVGRSVKYIYDRVKLFDAIRAVQDLLRDGTIGAAHAILLARLTPKQQEATIDADSGGLWQREVVELTPEREAADWQEALKPVSTRELETWINRHVKLDTKRVDAVVHPELDQALRETAYNGVIPITWNQAVHPDARDAARIWGPRSWKRADGQQGSQPCSSSKLGVIVVGPGRGDAFQVCVNRKVCNVHWSSWMAEADRQADARDTAHGRETTAAVNDAKRKVADARRQTIAAEIDRRIVAEVLEKAWPLERKHAELLLRGWVDQAGYPARDGIEEMLGLDKAQSKAASLEEIARALVGLAALSVLDYNGAVGQTEKLLLKPFKIDRAFIAKDVAAQLKHQEQGEEPVKATSKPAPPLKRQKPKKAKAVQARAHKTKAKKPAKKARRK